MHPIATLALLSGARRGELLALRWCDLDVDKGSVPGIERSLEQTRAGGLRFKEPKTPDSVRVISLPAGAVEALKAHRVRQLEQRMMLRQGGRPELVFTTLDGDPITPDVLSKAWSRQTAAKGMPQVHFHALRHTHASMLISEGIDIVQISERLGHASPTITLNTYSHLFKKDDDDLVSALEKALGGKFCLGANPVSSRFALFSAIVTRGASAGFTLFPCSSLVVRCQFGCQLF